MPSRRASSWTPTLAVWPRMIMVKEETPRGQSQWPQWTRGLPSGQKREARCTPVHLSLHTSCPTDLVTAWTGGPQVFPTPHCVVPEQVLSEGQMIIFLLFRPWMIRAPSQPEKGDCAPPRDPATGCSWTQRLGELWVVTLRKL